MREHATIYPKRPDFDRSARHALTGLHGVFVYQQELNSVGVVTILYEVLDGLQESMPQTVQIVIERPPVIIVSPPADREIQKVVSEPQVASNVETPRFVIPIAFVEVN